MDNIRLENIRWKFKVWWKTFWNFAWSKIKLYGLSLIHFNTKRLVLSNPFYFYLHNNIITSSVQRTKGLVLIIKSEPLLMFLKIIFILLLDFYAKDIYTMTKMKHKRRKYYHHLIVCYHGRSSFTHKSIIEIIFINMNEMVNNTHASLYGTLIVTRCYTPPWFTSWCHHQWHVWFNAICSVVL
jgi:hypothetical protein